MDELKRYRHGARNGVMTPDPEGPFVRYEDVAAALEAAREDAARYRALRDALLNDESEAWEAFIQQPEPKNAADFDAAIDQARGKGDG